MPGKVGEVRKWGEVLKGVWLEGEGEAVEGVWLEGVGEDGGEGAGIGESEIWCIESPGLKLTKALP